MIKYIADPHTPDDELRIVRKKYIRETKRYYISDRSRDSKSKHYYFDTYDEAVNFLIDEARKEAAKLRESLATAEERLEILKDRYRATHTRGTP